MRFTLPLFLRPTVRTMACLVLWYLSNAHGQGTADTPVQGIETAQCAKVSAHTCALARQLGRGINMGAMLEPPEEGDWGIRLDPAYADKVRGHFNTVRIPVRWSNHASPDAKATLDAFFLARVSKALDQFLSQDMYVIVNVHNYSQLTGSPLLPKEFAVDPTVLQTRLVNIWRQLGTHFKDRSPKLIFELLNEPSGTLDADTWNSLAARTLAAVRETNPDRVVMIGPVQWNAIKALPQLKLPPDRHLIVSVHNYDPFFFTHQGITYLPMPMPVGVKCCNVAQRREISYALQTAKSWSIDNGYPVHLGEFGSYQAADMESRVNYTWWVRQQAEKLGIPWAYWEFGHVFGIYSPKSGTWIEPLKEALLDK